MPALYHSRTADGIRGEESGAFDRIDGIYRILWGGPGVGADFIFRDSVRHVATSIPLILLILSKTVVQPESS